MSPGRSGAWPAAAAAGFLPAVVVLGAMHYTDVLHLAPVHFGIALAGAGLLLARPYLCARTARP
ncbi:hypothetical protein [Streptomyces cinereospinus]|uniref:Uncharacterized protein n=1 Tax=Streptomyces cinereospinus TaxID=285561 RepID=A0ABV5N0I8_9ACTN